MSRPVLSHPRSVTRVNIVNGSTTLQTYIPSFLALQFTKDPQLSGERKLYEVLSIFLDLAIGIVPQTMSKAGYEALCMLLDVMPFEYVLKNCRNLLTEEYGEHNVTLIEAAVGSHDVYAMREWNGGNALSRAVKRYAQGIQTESEYEEEHYGYLSDGEDY